jgi:hypothetical protein
VRVRPGEHGLLRGGLGEVTIGELLRLAERLEQRLRDPAVGFVNVAADDDRMHDRKDLRGAPIVQLHLDEILEHPAHAPAAVDE